MVKRWLVWLSRIHCCRGFGIQSPTDYAFVRYVVNEHWPYYAYERLQERDWLRRKLGRLYLRLANWRQPAIILSDDYHPWFHAGCQHSQLAPCLLPPASCSLPLKIPLARVEIEQHQLFQQLLQHTDQLSVIIVEGIWRDWQAWHTIEQDSRVGTTFDLYYCGIVLFDTQRFKHHYKINF